MSSAVDYCTKENIKAVGERAMQGNLVGLIFDNRVKLDKFLNLLFASYPNVKVVDDKPMAKNGPFKDSFLVRVRGGSVQ